MEEIQSEQMGQQEKSWQQLYWEEQERERQEKAAAQKRKIGVGLLCAAVGMLIVGLFLNVYRGGSIFGEAATDVLRAERSGQRAYVYMELMSEPFAYDKETGNLQFRYVMDHYGFITLVCIHKVDAKKYEDYVEEANWLDGSLKEVRLEGYAMGYDNEKKQALREYVADVNNLEPEEITDEMLEESFGKYYLMVDEKVTIWAITSWLMVVAGIVFLAAGIIVCTGGIWGVTKKLH